MKSIVTALVILSAYLTAGSAVAAKKNFRAGKASVKTQWTCHATGFGVIAMVRFFEATASTRNEAERRVLNECGGGFVCHYAECYKH